MSDAKEAIQVVHREAIAELSQNPRLQQWFIGTPATEEKKHKQRARKASQTSQAQAPVTRSGAGSFQAVAAVIANDEAWDVIEGKEGVHSSDKEDMLASDGVEEGESPAKHPKPEPEPPTEFTAYINIIFPPRTVKAKETSMTHGPFFFNLDTTHLKFLSLLAACTVDPGFSTAVTTINQSQLSWNLITLANDKKKPLSNEQGYRALLNKMNELSVKKKECTVTLSMPLPSKVVNSSRNKENTSLDNDESKEGPLGLTLREQKSVIDPEINALVDQLRERLRVWAIHLNADPPMATLEHPPNSAHFADSQRIHGPGAPTPLAAPTEQSPAPLNANANPYPAPIMPYGYPPYPLALGAPYYSPPLFAYPPYASAYPQPPFHYGDPCFHLSAHPRTPIAAPGSAPTSPLKITLPYPVLLSEFCKRYEIDEEDKGRLEKLKFLPGDRRAEKLECEDWQGHAGFSKLSWDDFVSKHKTFIRDVKVGCWNHAPV